MPENELQGRVVKLDRGYPLVEREDGQRVRTEHATELVKEGASRAVIGDYVVLQESPDHDKAIISRILPRRNELVRRDPSERTMPQVLAANFDTVIIAQPLHEVNIHRLERELVLAFETGARVVVVLTKADLSSDEERAQEIKQNIVDRVGNDVAVFTISQDDEESVQTLAQVIEPQTTAVLIGRSGVGKSSLVNLLAGEDVQATSEVRATDGKGRHTTVSREIIELPNGGFIVDMPGVRGLGLWEADEGIGAAFTDIEEAARGCRFSDCKHDGEPGCAVQEAVEAGEITQARLESYRALKQETHNTRERKRRAAWRSK